MPQALCLLHMVLGCFFVVVVKGFWGFQVYGLHLVCSAEGGREEGLGFRVFCFCGSRFLGANCQVRYPPLQDKTWTKMEAT